ncbi:restriction endonuclease subunit S [Mycobacteroides abscessus]|uniref:Restriction endonuclease S subunit n=1 Tax=Mycobacteroides abscessus TaxID=36809 RepID=A0A0U0ZNQ8_9MYCO|nr:restriction endonuclease subunit S [Mycobacteroides abscessus]MBL3733894.1 restriction endonuclease subunit S [Mycobacteroides abscessus subsp. massiliense]MBL3745103.1 restriction endonuclease subunit S [Mycobacteroides abscessus subsp. massiliense]MBL3760588.1 restriction endonuclease subunit S [Mycobacteroides abscessus subsp. massiliense]MBN7481521.1 restriction endonuclease subunit S [Mycobacteroides abscessus subsp. massiliense]MCU8691993.1 restriction endonuclease subunit S [Mycobact
MSNSANWPTRTVSELVGEVTSGGTPQSGSSRYYTEQEGIPFAKIDDLTATAGAFISDTFLHVNDVALRETALKAYPPGTILVSMYGTIGLVKITSNTLSANQAVAALVPPFKCDPKYLYHFLVWSRSRWERYKAQTTQANINGSIVKNFSISIPSVPEQQRIAEILDTLDDQIHVTEQIVEKLTSARVGLLTVLLTRGIDELGQVREARLKPDEFVETPLGQLPRSWSVRPLAELLSTVDPAMRSGPFGSALLKSELVKTGVPLLGIDNVHIDRFVADYTRFVTPAKAQELSRYRVRPEDVMITIMGTVGRACVVPGDIGHVLSSKHVWTMTFDKDRYLPYLVSLQLNHASWAKAHFRSDEQGGIMSAIRSETLRSLLLPVPPIQEQHKIANVLSAADQRLADEKAELAKLRLTKAGLVSDLLSDRVRVPMEVA